MNKDDLAKQIAMEEIIQEEEDAIKIEMDRPIICMHCNNNIVHCFVSKLRRNAINERFFFFKCNIHRSILCDQCARNNYELNIDFANTFTCLHKGLVGTQHWKNCVFNKCVVPEGYTDKYGQYEED